MKRRTFLTAAVATVASPMIHAQSSGLPSQVKIVVGFAPGGGTDILARVVAQKLGAMWGNSVIVENKPGATGTIACAYVAKQPGDGSCLLMTHIASNVLAPAMMSKPNFDAVNDFSPITLIGITPNLLVCSPEQKFRTVRDLVDRCKREPGRVTFGSSGTGSTQHLTLEMFKLMAGVDALHVPYKGSAPMLTDIIGRQLDYSFDTMTASAPYVKMGRIYAIAQSRGKRAKSYPNVPTMAEQGFPGFEASTWYGLSGPRSMPAPLAQRINEDVNKVLATPDVIARLDQYGAEDGGGSRERFAHFIESERHTWTKIIKEAKVTMDS